MAEKGAISAKLRRREIFGYSMGAIPTGLLAFVFSLKYIQLFYDKLALLPMYFVIGQIIYMTVNALNDPLLGQLSDRTNRDRWGSRRIIFIKYGGPIWALTFLLVWFPWSLTDQFIIFLHFTVSICLFDTFLTLVILVWLALLPEMTESIDERNRTYFWSVVVGSLVTLPFFVVLGNMDPLSQMFQFLMIITAVISTVCILILAALCKERPEFQKDEVFPLWKSIKETLKLRSFSVYVGFYFCMNLLSSLGLSYLFVYLLLLNRITTNALTIYFVIYIFGFFSQWVCTKLRPRWGMRKVILRFGVLRIIASVAIFLIVLIPSLEPLIWVGLVLATFFAGYGIFWIPMQYLAIDEDEVKTGTRREGIFIGIMALLTKPATSLGPIIATAVLAAFGYIQGAAIQTESVFVGIKVMMFLLPAAIAAISLVFIYYYPLDGERLRQMQEKLKEMHEKKLRRLKSKT